jgi:hypothetical protein
MKKLLSLIMVPAASGGTGPAANKRLCQEIKAKKVFFETAAPQDRSGCS